MMAVAMEEGFACVNLMLGRAGRQLGDRSLFPQNAEGRDAREVLAAFIEQHYLERPIPAALVVGEDLDVEELESTLTEHAKHGVRVHTRPTAERRAWLEMARQNALQALKSKLTEHSTQETRLAALREALGAPDTVQRIECFDVSHTMGEATVAACVVYDRMDMSRGEHRRYNIEGLAPGDDYRALAQALSRRYARIAGGGGVAADMSFIHRGKGQGSAAGGALAEVGRPHIALVAIPNRPERKPGLEELWVGEHAVALPP